MLEVSSSSSSELGALSGREARGDVGGEGEGEEEDMVERVGDGLGG